MELLSHCSTESSHLIHVARTFKSDCTLGVHEVLDSHVKSGVLERCSSAYRGFDEVTADTHFELGIIIYL